MLLPHAASIASIGKAIRVIRVPARSVAVLAVAVPAMALIVVVTVAAAVVDAPAIIPVVGRRAAPDFLAFHIGWTWTRLDQTACKRRDEA